MQSRAQNWFVRWETVRRLLTAAGFDLHVELIARPIRGARLRQEVARILSLTPEQRLEEAAERSYAAYLASPDTGMRR